MHVSGAQSPVRWGVVGLGWVAADFVAPAMVKSAGSRLAALSLERASGLGPRMSWRQDFSQSGVIFDVGVHLLDLIPWVSDQRFVDVSAFTHPDRRRREPDDTLTPRAPRRRLPRGGAGDARGHPCVRRSCREIASIFRLDESGSPCADQVPAVQPLAQAAYFTRSPDGLV
jgi:hypothetical protein